MEFPHMNAPSAREIALVCHQYLLEHEADFKKAHAAARAKALSLEALQKDPAYREAVLRFARHNDLDLETLGLSNRSLSRLREAGYRSLSDILFLTGSDLKGIPGMGINSIQEILFTIQKYFAENSERIRSVCSGDESALVTDEDIRAGILRLYQTAPFCGLHFPEIREGLQLPPSVPDERIKHIVGSLLADLFLGHKTVELVGLESKHSTHRQKGIKLNIYSCDQRFLFFGTTKIPIKFGTSK